MLDWIASFMQDNSFEIKLVNLGLKLCNYSRNKYIEVIMREIEINAILNQELLNKLRVLKPDTNVINS